MYVCMYVLCMCMYIFTLTAYALMEVKGYLSSTSRMIKYYAVCIYDVCTYDVCMYVGSR